MHLFLLIYVKSVVIVENQLISTCCFGFQLRESHNQGKWIVRFYYLRVLKYRL